MQSLVSQLRKNFSRYFLSRLQAVHKSIPSSQELYQVVKINPQHVVRFITKTEWQASKQKDITCYCDYTLFHRKRNVKLSNVYVLIFHQPDIP